ncbi:MAG: BatA domain-containing protein, partial [Acidobacteria bacterium]|nr:BatA domain-containing protein [Acidobacteriota bacterium]
MFGFLNSAILIGLTGVAIPILIHLFARQRRKRILFSNIALLSQLETRRMQRFKILQQLLLLLRILAVLLIVLAFARPVIRSHSFFRTSQSSAAELLILDRSASMNRGDVFVKTQQRALDWTEALGSEDGASLLWIDHGDETDLSWRRSVDSFRREIAQSSVTQEYGNLGVLLPQVQDLLSHSRQLNKEIYLVSDFQAGSLKTPRDTTAQITEPVSVFAIPIAGETQNIAIVSGGIASQILQPGLPFRIFATVQNFGKEDVDDLRIRALLNGKAVAQQSVRLDADANRRVEFLVQPESAGPFYGSVEIDDDALSSDNTCYFTGLIPSKLNVSLVGHTDADLSAIALALSAFQNEAGLFYVHFFTQNQDWSASLSDADVVIFSNYPAFSAREADALRAYFASGGGAVIIPGPNMDAVNYQSRIFEPFCQIQIGETAGANTPSDGTWSLGRADFQHPLFEDLFQDSAPQIASPRVFRRLEISGISGPPILAFRDGLPFLTEKRALEGRVLIFATGLHSTWSDFSFTPLFAPLMYRAGIYLSRRAEADGKSVKVGEPI